MIRNAVALTVLVAAASACAWAQVPPLQISLEQSFERALFRSCELNVQVVARTGRSTLRCVWNRMPPTELAADRALTPQETERLLALTTGSAIWSGTFIGVDPRAVDGMFETVTINRRNEVGVLVASGNPSFDTGPRRQLLNLLHSILEDLQRAGRK